MAKIKYSALVSDMRNKLNGSVMSKNRYGSYLRNKVTPVNPQSTEQQNARQILSTLSGQWGGLTEAQRQGWNALAPSLPFTDIFGDVKHLSGQSLYVKLNANLLKLEIAANSAAPAPAGLPSMLLTEVVAVATAGVITTLTAEFVEQTVPADHSIAIYATPGVQAGVSFVKNRYRFIGALSSITAGVGDIAALWNARYGTVAVGQKIFVRAALIDETSGQQGIPSQEVAVITGT